MAPISLGIATLVALVSLPNPHPAPAYAAVSTTWWVAETVDVPEVDRDGTSEETGFGTVADAIKEANAGDTIRVAPGAYPGFTVDESVTIVGPNADVAPDEISGETVRSGVGEATIQGRVLIDVGTKSVELSGFSFDGSEIDGDKAAITARSNTGGITIRNNVISGVERGLLTEGNSQEYGEDWTVSHNYIHSLRGTEADNAYGMQLRNLKNVVVSNNRIEGELEGDGLRRGILLRGTQNAEVKNNYIDLGLDPEDYDFADENPSVLTSNAGDVAYYAISVQQKLNDIVDGFDNGDDLEIADVVISGNFLRGASRAVNLFDLDNQSNGVEVTGNTVEDVDTGVILRSFGQSGEAVVDELVVAQNDFDNAKIAGVEIFSISPSDPAENEFAGVTIQGNSLPPRGVNAVPLDVVFDNGALSYPPHTKTIGDIDARGNWWGSAEGPVDVEDGGPQGAINAEGWITSFTLDSNRTSDPGFWLQCANLSVNGDPSVARAPLCPSTGGPSSPTDDDEDDVPEAVTGSPAPLPTEAALVGERLSEAEEALNARVRALPLPTPDSVPDRPDQPVVQVGAREASLVRIPGEALSVTIPQLVVNSQVVRFDQDQGVLVLPGGPNGTVEAAPSDVRVWEVGQISIALAFLDDDGEVIPQREEEKHVGEVGSPLLKVINGLPPEAPVRIFIFSDPTDLGVFEADQRGEVNVTEALPDSIPAGEHTLRIVTPNRSGEIVTADIPIVLEATEPEVAQATPDTGQAQEPDENAVETLPADEQPPVSWILWLLLALAVLALLSGIVVLINARRRRT